MQKEDKKEDKKEDNNYDNNTAKFMENNLNALTSSKFDVNMRKKTYGKSYREDKKEDKDDKKEDNKNAKSENAILTALSSAKMHKNIQQKNCSKSYKEDKEDKEDYKNIVDTSTTFICKCTKIYKHRQGLWKHKKVCVYLQTNKTNVTNEVIKATVNSYKLKPSPANQVSIDLNMIEAFMTLMKQNQEFKELIMEQNDKFMEQAHEFQKQLLDVSKENKTINNTTNNNSFNLNVYLNETCKDAINMLDYVNSLNLDLSDLEETGKLGYSNGMSRIFINGLKDMDVHMRPIHCSDLKREILYIKEDNVWEKDNENRDGIKNALRKIEQKNIQQIPLWIKAHPNCVISSNRENTPYLKMVMQSTGGQNPDETENMSKIITNIAKAVVINK